MKKAFPYTLPVMAGYMFIGIAYGIYMQSQGFSVIYPVITALIIYGGSLEFICVSMLLSPFAPLTVFVMALLVQARHLFYGLSMLEKYKGMGIKKFYLIYGLSDETFSVTYNTPVPEGVDKGVFYFWITLLDQSYWVIGSFIGATVGGLLPFNTESLGFVMTAMFVAIFMDQWVKEKRHMSAYVGFFASVVSLIIFGPDSFLIPAMVAIVGILTLLRGREEALDNANDHS